MGEFPRLAYPNGKWEMVDYWLMIPPAASGAGCEAAGCTMRLLNLWNLSQVQRITRLPKV